MSSSPAPPTSRPAFRERVHVPWHWWALGVLFAVSVLLAVLFYLGPMWGFGVTGIVLALITWWLLAYGGAQIRVDDEGLHVGQSLLAWEWLGATTPHSVEASRERLGPGADARAWLFVRPYLNRVVEVTVDDHQDPHPYWLIGTRHPERLAEAIEATRPRSTHGVPAHQEA